MTKAQINIILRLEASHKKGLGHLMRCINLCSHFPIAPQLHVLLKKEAQQTAILELLKKNNCKFLLLDTDISQEEEIEQVFAYATAHASRLIITDLCHWEILHQEDYLYQYHQRLKERCQSAIYVFSIEDARLRKFSSDLVLLPNPVSDQVPDYEADAACEVIYGNEYYIANPIFNVYSFDERTIKPIAKNILVVIGGSDPYNITFKLAQVLKDFKQQTIRLIIGLSRSKEEKELFAALELAHDNIEVLAFTNNIVEQFLWADVAITGEGNIKFEAALTGTPTLLLTQFDHSSAPVAYFISKKTCLYLGRGEDFDEAAIRESIKQLLASLALRKELSQNGIHTFSANGGSAIYTNYLKDIIHQQ